MYIVFATRPISVTTFDTRVVRDNKPLSRIRNDLPSLKIRADDVIKTTNRTQPKTSITSLAWMPNLRTTIPDVYSSILKLPVQQVLAHVLSSKVRGTQEGVQVPGGERAVQEAKRQHQGDPTLGQLQGPPARGHQVLLDVTLDQVVDVTGVVDLGSQRVRGSGLLVASQDVEVVVGKVDPSVALGARGGPEENEVLRNQRVQNKHRPHGTTGVVEHPVVPVQVVDDGGVLLLDLGRQFRHDGRGVPVGVVLKHLVHQLLEHGGLKHVVAGQPGVVQGVEDVVHHEGHHQPKVELHFELAGVDKGLGIGENYIVFLLYDLVAPRGVCAGKYDGPDKIITMSGDDELRIAAKMEGCCGAEKCDHVVVGWD